MTWFREIVLTLSEEMDKGQFTLWQDSLNKLDPPKSLEKLKFDILLLCLNIANDGLNYEKFPTVKKGIDNTRLLLNREDRGSDPWKKEMSKWSVKMWVMAWTARGKDSKKLHENKNENKGAELLKAIQAAGVAEWATMDRTWSVAATVWTTITQDKNTTNYVAFEILKLIREQ